MNRILAWCHSWCTFYRCLLAKRRREEARKLTLAAYLRLCRDGFFPNKSELYDFDKYPREKYINDQQMLRTAHINGEEAVLLEDKILFELAIGRFVHVPPNYFYWDKGHFVSLNPDIKDMDDVKEFLKRQKSLIIKPTHGLGGKGIVHLQFDQDGFSFNGCKKSWRQIALRLVTSGDIIGCEYVRQGAFASRLYPQTVNTMRMLSMRNPESGLAFIAAAVFRIGCSRSWPVDNISSGGIVCDIDIDKGCLGRAATGFYDKGPFRWIDKHPDTGIRMQGLTIDGWARICNQVETLADKFPRLPYIAWDIALGDRDIIVIEGNAWSDVSLFQIYRPLLLDNRIDAFLKHHYVS